MEGEQHFAAGFGGDQLREVSLCFVDSAEVEGHAHGPRELFGGGGIRFSDGEDRGIFLGRAGIFGASRLVGRGGAGGRRIAKIVLGERVAQRRKNRGTGE